MLSSIRRHHITRVVLSGLTAALVVGTMGCVGETSSTVKYDLTIASGEGGSVTEPGEGMFTVDSGRIVDLVATPASGYRFDGWTGNVDTIANVNAPSTTITVDGDYSITANFGQTEWLYYSLTTTISPSGAGSVSPDGGTYAAGSQVTLTANPASGYTFSNWGGDASGSQNPITITMNSNTSITAYFGETEGVYYTLTTTVSPSEAGSVGVAPTGGTYAAGSQVTLTANPASGYTFSNWGGDASGTQNPITVTINGNYSVTANFESDSLPPVPWDQYTLTMAVNPGAGGTTTPTGTTPYAEGTVVNITASANSDYVFVEWTAVAGVTFDNPAAPTTSFTMPAQNITVTANFEVIQPSQYILTISSTAGGTVTAPGVGTFARDAGTGVDLVADPDTGYRFVSWTGNVGTIANVNAASTTITMNSNYSITANFQTVDFMICAGDLHTVGVKSSDVVIAVGNNVHGQCNVGGWTSIIKAAAGGFHTAGLKSGGTVVATGNNQYGQCNVSGWTDVIQVAAGGYHTVGLRSDGTVVATGYNSYGQCNVDSWANIIQIAAGGFHTVGLRSDGTVVTVGNNWYGQQNVNAWTNIIQVAAGSYHTVGLRSSATAVAVGDNARGQCNVGSWTDVIQVAAGGSYTVGLRANGTVAAVGDNHHGQCNVSGWTNIIQVTAGWQHTAGLKSDGTVIATGNNQYGQCSVDGWDLS